MSCLRAAESGMEADSKLDKSMIVGVCTERPAESLLFGREGRLDRVDRLRARVGRRGVRAKLLGDGAGLV